MSKKFLAIIAILFSCQLTFAQENTKYNPDEEDANTANDTESYTPPKILPPLSMYITVGVIPMTTNFNDIVIRDIYSADYKVGITDKNTKGYNLNFNLGFNYSLSNRFDLLLDCHYSTSGSFYTYGASLGGSFHIINLKKFQLSLIGKAGYIHGVIDLGTVAYDYPINTTN